jgi:integrase
MRRRAPPSPPPSQLVVAPQPSELSLHVEPEVVDRLHEVLQHANAKNTVRAFKSDWRVFTRWCEKSRANPLPASTAAICAFLADQSLKKKASTVTRYLTGIAYLHRLKGFPNPTEDPVIQESLRGIRRKLGVRPDRRAPADAEVMRKLLAAVEQGTALSVARDRALLLVGYAGAFRRSALCALQIEDLTIRKDRMDVLVRRGKEDQEGEGRILGIARSKDPHLCPVGAVERLVELLKARAGPLFRPISKWGTPRSTALDPDYVWKLIRRAAEAAGLDPKLFGAHSLRAGHATQAARRGAQLQEIMVVGGWKSADTVMRYIREADTLRGSSATKVDLGDE